MQPYQFFPHTADLIFEAYGTTLEELFANAGLATEEVMVNLKTVTPTEKKAFKLQAESVEELLYHFLEELIFLKDTDSLLFSEFVFKVQFLKQNYVLTGFGKGEIINPEKHDLGQDVKAVTKHLFEVKQQGMIWTAKVLLDI
ncbi:archease [Candidatus Woesearchaeota archaeon]|nr:archease [Candidatus Woesearchaeota archaeon]